MTDDLKVWLVALAALTLAGCAAGPAPFDPAPLFPASEAVAIKPATAPAPVKAGSSHPWIQVDLVAVLALAGANDLEIATAQQRLEQSQARRDEAVYGFFPGLLPSASFHRAVGEYQSTPGAFVDVTRQQTLAGIRARLELDVGHAIFALAGAKHGVEGASHALKARRHQRLLRASRGYYELSASVQRVEIAREALTFSKALLSHHESKRRQGFGLTLDVERARASVEAAQTAMAEAEMRFRAVSNRLATQLRLDPRVTLYPGEATIEKNELIPADTALDGLVKSAMAANPGLEEARSGLSGAESRLDAATYAWLIPRVFLEGSLDQRGENPTRFGDTDQFTAGLQWEISLGIGARQRSAQAVRNQAAISLARARERLVASLVALEDEVDLNDRRIAASERRIKASETALQIANSRMREGAGLMLDVLNARVELTQARLSRLDAITDYNKGQVSLLVLTGRSPRGTGSSPR